MLSREYELVISPEYEKLICWEFFPLDEYKTNLKLVVLVSQVLF